MGESADLPECRALRFLDDFELLAEVARGGSAVVWRARQTSVDRIVALKLLRAPDLRHPAARERFRLEATAASGLRHAHIITLHGFGVTDGQPWIAMEFVEGQSLAESIRGRPFEPQRAARLLKSLADAREYAHWRGVLHRDLKPSNVLVDPEGEPRITDFGLAKHFLAVEDEKTAEKLTPTGPSLGTPNCMPPNICRCEKGRAVRRARPATSVI